MYIIKVQQFHPVKEVEYVFGILNGTSAAKHLIVGVREGRNRYIDMNSIISLRITSKHLIK